MSENRLPIIALQSNNYYHHYYYYHQNSCRFTKEKRGRKQDSDSQLQNMVLHIPSNLAIELDADRKNIKFPNIQLGCNYH